MIKSNISIFSLNESQTAEAVATLLDGDFTVPSEPTQKAAVDISKPSSALLDLNWSTNSDFLSGDFMPSKLIQDNLFNMVEETTNETNDEKNSQKPVKAPKDNQVSWLSLFAELDPLANNPLDDVSGNRA